MNFKSKSSLLILILSSLPCTQILAATASSTLSISATVIANCSISTTAVAFGNYDPIGANATTDLTGNGAVTITCTTGASPTISLGYTGGTGSTRQMTNGTSTLNYQLYQPVISGTTSSCPNTTVWGDGTTGSSFTASAGNGSQQSYTVCGKIPAGQNVPVGSYNDTITATVNF